MNKKLIKPGARVRHPEFGVGTLLGYNNFFSAVEFDKKHHGHDCVVSDIKLIRPAKKDKGWFVPPNELTPILPAKRKSGKKGKKA